MLAACNKDNDDIQPTQNGYTEPKRLESITDISYSQNYGDYNPETGQYDISSTSSSKDETTLQWSADGMLLGYNSVNSLSSEQTTIEYDGNKIKTIAIKYNDLLANTSERTYICSYTNDNLTSLYASLPNQGWEMTTFTYNPNGELLTMRKENSNGELVHTTLTWTNGNVTHVEESHPPYVTYTYDYIYDNKTSAYKGMENFVLLKRYDFFLLSKNNVMQTAYNNYDTITYTYTYDGDWPTSYKTTHSCYRPSSGSYSSENTNYLRYTDGSGVTPQIFTISATSNMSESSGVYVYGSGKYEAGRQVVLRTFTYGTYHNLQFRFWNDGVTDNPRTFTVTGEAQFIAIYENTDKK